MFRLLSEIYNIPCTFTQQALIKCTDKPTLALLQSAFPTCLVNHLPKPVAWGDLLEYQVQYHYEDLMRSNLLCDGVKLYTRKEIREWAQWGLIVACEHFQVPLVAYWDDGTLGLPKELLLQLRTAKQEQPLYLRYEGKKCLVVDIQFYDEPPMRYEDEKEEHNKIVVCNGRLGLVDADAVKFK